MKCVIQMLKPTTNHDNQDTRSFQVHYSIRYTVKRHMTCSEASFANYESLP